MKLFSGTRYLELHAYPNPFQYRTDGVFQTADNLKLVLFYATLLVEF